MTVEQVQRRADTAQAVAAGLLFLDVGAAEHARREAVIALRPRVRVRLRLPRARWVVPAWIGATVLLRSPWLWSRALFAATAAAAAVGLSRTRRYPLAWMAVATLAAYAAASSLVEPVRAEDTQRFGIHKLAWGERQLLLRHLPVPVVALAGVAGVVGGASATVAGARQWAWAAALGGAAAAPGLVMAAAYAALRPPPDTSLLFYGETGAQPWLTQPLPVYQPPPP